MSPMVDEEQWEMLKRLWRPYQRVRGVVDPRPLVTLRLGPVTLVEKFGLHFSPAEDGFDYLHECVIKALDSGNAYLLMRYDNSPSLGTDVYGDSHIGATNLVADLVGALGIDLADIEVIWDGQFWSSLA